MIKDIIIHMKWPLTHPKTCATAASWKSPSREPTTKARAPPVQAQRTGPGDPAAGRRKRGLRRGRILFSPYLESTRPAWVDRLLLMRRSTVEHRGDDRDRLVDERSAGVPGPDLPLSDIAEAAAAPIAATWRELDGRTTGSGKNHRRGETREERPKNIAGGR